MPKPRASTYFKPEETPTLALKKTSRMIKPRAKGMIKLIDMTNSFLHSLDDSFPLFEFSTADIDIRHGYYGKRYALFTVEGMEAVILMKEYEGIKLDGTYTGKTLAAIIEDAKSGSLKGSTILFWNTLILQTN